MSHGYQVVRDRKVVKSQLICAGVRVCADSKKTVIVVNSELTGEEELVNGRKHYEPVQNALRGKVEKGR